MSETSEASKLLRLTAKVVAAHVAHNPIVPDALPELIRSVHASLAGAGKPAVAVQEKQQPAVPPRKSVFPDFIVCLEDGKKLKMLKRHLQTHYQLTPEQYRERWGLPHDYPMVAPNYAERRSVLARENGLGRKPQAVAAAPIPAPRKAGRPRKNT